MDSNSIKPSSIDAQVQQALDAHFSGKLEFIGLDPSGSTSRVFHVRMVVSPGLDLKVDRIVKVFRHDGNAVLFPEFDALLQHEVRKLIPISHTNLVSIYYAGTLRIDEETTTRYYVMEYVPGAKTLDNWLRDVIQKIKSEHIIDMLLQIGSGLQTLHQAGIVHGDVQFNNLLVSEQNILKLSNIGISRIITSTSDDGMGHFVVENFPSRYRDFIRKEQNSNRLVIHIPREQFDSSFDLHYFGRIIRSILGIRDIAAKFDALEAKSLDLIAERTNLDAESRLPRYTTVNQVISDLRKLLPVFLNRPGLRELSAYTGTRTIRIPVTGSIPFPSRVEQVVAHPLFLRLHNAVQLGFSYYVFPGAVHTRFEHSLGVFANVTRYIVSLLSDDYQPYFRQVIDEEKIDTVLLTGLIHDIGQNSFAHSLEDLGLVPKHETVASAFITGDGIEELVSDRFLSQGPLNTVLSKMWPDVDLPRLLWIITGERPAGMPSDVGWEIMHSIINGPIDADKTDYLLRDAHHAGVEYARSIDVTRFMNSLSAAVVRENLKTKGVLAITWKGAQSTENIILARSQMFWVLYWHHAVRSAHGTIGECCFEHLRNADTETTRHFKQTLYCGTTGELLALLEASHSERARTLASLLRHRRLYKRGIDLDYRDDERLYLYMINLKNHFTEKGDLLLKAVAEAIADNANKWLARERSLTRLTADNVMVDVPKMGKDVLGSIYVVDRNSEQAREYTSRGLIGTTEDWQNRVRTIRVFLSPDIERSDREIIRRYGREILEGL